MNESITMNRKLGLKESITITVGTVIGVGLFTVGANGVGYLGPVIILATIAAFLVSIFPSLLYAEMGACLPYAGGTYNYASLGINKLWGMLAGWNFVVSLIAVTSGEALAFAYYFKTLFGALNIPLSIDERILAVSVILLFVYINWRGIEITGKLQNAFMFFFWGVAIVWFISMFSKVNMSFYHISNGSIDISIRNFIFTTSLIWWCFAGFETCCAMGEEIQFPQINIPRAMFLTPFIIFVVTALFQWFLLGIIPPESLSVIQEASAPYADAMKLAGILGFPLIMLCAGIAFGGDFSTLNASIAAPSRYLFSMARDGVLPSVFAKLHPKYKTPYISVFFLGILAIGLVATGSIIYIASLSLFADMFYYIIGFASIIGLRKKYPHIPRPYKAPAPNIIAIISIILYIVMMTQLPKDAFLTGLVWCIIGIGVYTFFRKNTTPSNEENLKWPSLEEPSIEERKQLDKEFHVWRAIVGIFFILTIGLYALPYLL